MTHSIGLHHITRTLWAWCLFLDSACYALDWYHRTHTNVTIPSTSPEIVYTPFVCNASTTLVDSQSCQYAWQTLNLGGTPFVFTDGPTPESTDIIPQMFFRFQALALYITTSPFSNSTSNITVSTNTTTTTTVIDTSGGLIAVLNLSSATVTSVAITLLSPPDASNTRLDIGPLMLTIMNSPNASSSIFPSETLPSSTPLPTITFVPSSSASPSPSPSSNHRLVVLACSIVPSLVFGLTAVAAAGYIFWKRLRKRGVQGGGDETRFDDDEKF